MTILVVPAVDFSD